MTILITLLLIVCCSMIGRIVTYLSGNRSTDVKGLFFSILAGALFLVSVKGIIETGGKTVFILVIPVVVMYLVAKRREAGLAVSGKLAAFLAGDLRLLLFSLPFILVLCLLSGTLKPGADEFYYISLAESNSMFGVESTFSNYMPYHELWGGYAQNSKYHYFDLWLSSLLFDIFPVSNATLFISVLFPFFGFVFLLSIASIGSHFWRTHSFWLLLVSFVFSFIVMIYPLGHVPHYFNREISGPRYLAYTPLSSIKYILGPVLMALSFAALQRRSLNDLWFFGSMVAVCHYIFFPVIVTSFAALALAIWVLRYWRKNKDFSAAQLWQFMGYTVVSALMLWGIYQLFNLQYPESELVSASISLDQLGTRPYLVSMITSLVENMYQLLSLLPVIIVVAITFFFWKKWAARNYLFLAWLVILLGWGIIPRSFLNPILEESWQLEFYFLFIPLLMLTITGYFAVIGNRTELLRGMRRYLVGGLIAIHLLFSLYVTTEGFMKNRQDNMAALKQLENIKVLAARAGEDFSGKGVFLSDTTGIQCSENLKKIYLNDFSGFARYMSKNTSIVSIDPIDQAFTDIYAACNFKPSTKRQILGLTMSAPFVKYHFAHKEKSVAENQVSFIQHFGIDYLIAENKATIPPHLLAKARQVIREPVSGLQICFF